VEKGLLDVFWHRRLPVGLSPRLFKTFVGNAYRR
jgi:hypothetical protein